MVRRCLFVFAGIALTASVACTGSIAAFTYAGRWLDPFEARRFEAQEWAAAAPEDRAAMARDAIRHLPAGLPEAEIQALLGRCSVHETRRLTRTAPPGVVQELPWYGGSAPPGAVRTYSYYLGSWSVAYHDDTFLWVHVGEDGRVIAAVIGGG